MNSINTQSLPAPHGYPDRPSDGAFYSLPGPLHLSDSLGANKTYIVNERRGQWSGKGNPPAIGARVNVKMNRLGAGTVVAYFVESQWLGVEVKPDARPDWHVRANRDTHPHYLVFGAEIDSL